MYALLEKTGTHLEIGSSMSYTEVEKYVMPESQKVTIRWWFSIIFAVGALVVTPFLVITPNVASGVQAPLIGSMLFIALLPLTFAMAASLATSLKDEEHANVDSWPAIAVAIAFAVLAVLILWMSGADRNGTGYHLVSANFGTYLIFGLPPVIAYAFTLRWSFRGAAWAPRIILAAVSLLAVWFWAGYATNLVGGALW